MAAGQVRKWRSERSSTEVTSLGEMIRMCSPTVILTGTETILKDRSASGSNQTLKGIVPGGDEPPGSEAGSIADDA